MVGFVDNKFNYCLLCLKRMSSQSAQALLIFPLETQPRAKLFCAHDFCKICASKKTHNLTSQIYPLKLHKPPGIKTYNFGVLHLKMDLSL